MSQAGELPGWSGATSASAGSVAEVRWGARGALVLAGIGSSVDWLRDYDGASSEVENASDAPGSFAIIERGVDQVFIRASGDAMVVMRAANGTIKRLTNGQQRHELRAVESAVLVVGVVDTVDMAALETWLKLGAVPSVVKNQVDAGVEHALVFVEGWNDAVLDLGGAGDLLDDDAILFLAGGVFEPPGAVTQPPLEPDEHTDEVRRIPQGTIPPPGMLTDSPPVVRTVTPPRPPSPLRERVERSVSKGAERRPQPVPVAAQPEGGKPASVVPILPAAPNSSGPVASPASSPPVVPARIPNASTKPSGLNRSALISAALGATAMMLLLVITGLVLVLAWT